MKYARSLTVSAVFILIGVAVAVWLYPHLPAQTPRHWNLRGQVDGYWPSFWAAVMLPLELLGLTILMVLLPWISPRRFEITPFARVYVFIMLMIQGFVLVFDTAVLYSAAGHAVPIPLIAMLGSGLLFLIMGNYMGKLRKNFFIGIRTPWTLASDAVWERTHRLGGWAFTLGGAVLVIGTLMGGVLWPVIAALVIAASIPAVYSLVIYRRLEGRRARKPGEMS